jgi:hypothetical protein
MLHDLRRLLALGWLGAVLASPWLQACSHPDKKPSATASTNSPVAGDSGAESSSAPSGGAGGAAGAAPNAGAPTESPEGQAGMAAEPGAGGVEAVDPSAGVGGAPSEQDLLCAKFCDDEAAICTDALQQYADARDCLAECAGFSRGIDGDTMGNTLDCRLYYLTAAASAEPDAAATNCPHTAAHPAFYCKD